MIERNIDYLAFSAPSNIAHFLSGEYKPCSPIPFYKTGFQAQNGTRYYFGNVKNPELCHVVLSGQTLTVMRNDGYTDQGILEFAFSQQAKVSRLDLAITKYVDDWFITVSDVAAWYAMGWFTGALADRGAKTIARLEEDGGLGLETLYIGDIKKRGKKGLFRAYDKGLEFNIGDYLITRLELEEKHENAHATATRIAKGESIASCFRARLDCNCDEFQRLMDSPVADIKRGQNKVKTEEDDKMDSRWKWLIEQVAPSLRGAIENEEERTGENQNLREFLFRAGITQKELERVIMLDRKEPSKIE